MAENLTSRLWLMRIAYVGFALAIIYARLLPLENRAGVWATPDLVVAMTFAWALRRPDFVPALSVAAVLLLADLLLLRPPGLLATLVLLGTVALQRRQRDIREMGFALEWLTVSVALAAILICENLLLGMFVVPRVSFGQSLIQGFVTALFYPVVVLFSETVLGVRRVIPGDVSAAGQRA